MNVYFVDCLPEFCQGAYIDYFDKDHGLSECRRIDLKPRLTSRQEGFFASIEKWHTELCIVGARQFKWWWLLPASRLILWHPPIWKPLIFALAMAEELESFSGNEVYVTGCPEETAVYLQEFCAAIKVVDKRKKCQRALPGSLRGSLASLKYLFDVLIFILLHRKRQPIIEGASPIIIWTYLLIPGAESVTTKDHFFGDMFKPDDFKYPVHWVCHGSLRNNSGKCSPVYTDGDRSLIYDWIGISEWCSLVRFYFFEWCFNRTPIVVPEFVLNGHASKSFAKNFAAELIERTAPLAEMTALLGLKKILRESSPRALIYPYEEKCMERALLMAVEETKKTTLTVGFAHAVYNKGLMYLRRRNEIWDAPPMPDRLLATGAALKKWLVDWAKWDEKRVLIGGSPRWHNTTGRNAEVALRGCPLRVLILIGQDYEATELSNQFEKLPSAFDTFEVIIRPYPYSWGDGQDKAFSKIKTINRHIRVDGGSLDEQIAWCDVAVYCSTSAGVETMLSGRLTIYLNLNQIFSLSPIDEKIQSKALWKCQNISELNKLLYVVNQMKEDQYTDIVGHQCNAANQLFQKIDYSVLNGLLKSNQASSDPQSYVAE